jgi:hypothetical protein
MKLYWITILTILTMSLLLLVGGNVPTSEATTTFIGSTIVSIDHAEQTVTFLTLEGQSWTLPVADPNVLKNGQVAKGDQVSIEIDPSDRITKIVKLAEQPRS